MGIFSRVFPGRSTDSGTCFLRWASLFGLVGTGCAWTGWKDATVRTPPLVLVEQSDSVRILGFDLSPGSCATCGGHVDVGGFEDYAVARARTRLKVEDVEVADGCSGRACVRWDSGHPCLTPSYFAQNSARSWGIALRLVNYEEGIAEGVINLARDSSPSFSAMDVVLFDPDNRWVTTQRVRLSRDEWGALSHTIGSDPLLIASTFAANGEVVNQQSEMGDLPRSLGSGWGTMLRQTVDDSMWLLSWMTSSHESGGPLVLHQRGGAANEEAVSLATKGRVEEAVSQWQTLDTTDSRIAFNLGMAYAVLGDDTRSIEHFQIAELQRSRRFSRLLLRSAQQRDSFRSRTRPQGRCNALSSVAGKRVATTSVRKGARAALARRPAGAESEAEQGCQAGSCNSTR